MHPHELLPLESRLPRELHWEERDRYRIIMTMILSGGASDRRLSTCLGKVFKRYPNFESMRNLQKHEIKLLLRECGFTYVDPDRGGNGGRLWSFLECYHGARIEAITEADILGTLHQKNGFIAGHFVALVQAYCFGNNNVIPLDRPALSALRDPLFPAYCNFSDSQIRQDIEDKLRGEAGVSLIDFHEMLRFIEQYTGKSRRKQDNIVIGWNAWRLLCSNRCNEITADWTWIYNNLVKDERLAKELWQESLSGR
jgi:hypothetical protein